MLLTEPTQLCGVSKDYWPSEVREAFNALESFAPRCERRKLRRTRYYAAAEMLASLGGPAPVYTRDVNPWLIGMVTSCHLNNYDHVMLHLPLPNQMLEVECTVRRCVEFIPGWYDCSLHFRHEQSLFRDEEWLDRPVR